MQLSFDFTEIKVSEKKVSKEKIGDNIITKNPALDGITEKEMVRMVEKETGIKFAYNKDRSRYECKRKKKIISLCYGNYNYYEKPLYQGVKHEERYIGCDYEYNLGGCGHAVDTIEKAIEFVNKYKSELER